MTFKTPLLIAALAAALTTQATAQNRGPMAGDRPSFAELDADGDGALTAEELRASMAARAAAADTDGDGALSAAEIEAAMLARQSVRMSRMAERMLARHDADGSGDLSLEELARAEPRQEIFEHLDTDRDGAISEEEFAARQEGRGRYHGDCQGHGGRL